MSQTIRTVVDPARSLLAIAGVAALLALSGCAAGNPESSGGGEVANPGSSAPDDTTEAAPETACPDGFVEAWGAAAATNYEADFTFREATVEEFQPRFLAPSLDGGCAIFASGTNNFAGFFAEAYYGFSPDAGKLDDVTAALEKAGYVASDPATPFSYTGPNGEFAIAAAVGGDVHIEGDLATVKYFPSGIVFH